MHETTVISDVYKKEITEGLKSQPKYISSKYFYDDEGSRIFQDIMRMPEYYLTDCEYQIFDKQKTEILHDINTNEEQFDLVELGAGDGLKTSLLIEHFLNSRAKFKYVPVDISEDVLGKLVDKMKIKFPELILTELAGDYFQVLGDLNYCGECKKLVLFLGSNIGNFNTEEAAGFLEHLSSVLNKGDMVLIGFDLVKDPNIILKAYDDEQGFTRDFNLNLLRRLNNELGADFNPDHFIHYPIYDPVEMAAKSYLISTKKQSVYFGELDMKFEFDSWEYIFTERSQKFNKSMIEDLASRTGYVIRKNYTDGKGFFVDSLWEKM